MHLGGNANQKQIALGLFVCAADLGYSAGLTLADYVPFKKEKRKLVTTQAGLLETKFCNSTRFYVASTEESILCNSM